MPPKSTPKGTPRSTRQTKVNVPPAGDSSPLSPLSLLSPVTLASQKKAKRPRTAKATLEVDPSPLACKKRKVGTAFKKSCSFKAQTRKKSLFKSKCPHPSWICVRPHLRNYQIQSVHPKQIRSLFGFIQTWKPTFIRKTAFLKMKCSPVYDTIRVS